jgi:hypothetical protein
MKPVRIVSMPHNHREPLHEDELEPGETMPASLPYLTLPIPMPETVVVITGTDRDDVLAIHCSNPNGRIRREDLATVWLGIQQYNSDLAALG